MWNFKWLGVLPCLAAVILLCGCANSGSHDAFRHQTGESVVLVGQAPANLAFAPLLSKPVTVRSTYRDRLPQTVLYQPGQDYTLDDSGQIRRTPGSRIPDFGMNMLYGKEDFRHDQFPGFGNGRFFVYMDYAHQEKWARPTAKPELGAARLSKTRLKLEAGERVRIVAFGDSITAGGDASEPALIFWERWAGALRQKYPRASIETTNGATGGDATVQGLQRLQEKVLQQKPDLVLIGFGMNDHNREGYGVPLDAFTANLRTIIDRIRADTGAEVLLFSAFPPNPKWHFGSHNMEAYANATERVAIEKRCAYADVYHCWMSLAARKKLSCFHPNAGDPEPQPPVRGRAAVHWVAPGRLLVPKASKSVFLLAWWKRGGGTKERLPREA
jgi:lysophospholipase L1-like esterase